MYHTDGVLRGTLTNRSFAISAELNTTGELIGQLQISQDWQYEPYTGDYEITPLVNDEISMNTRNKVMTNDVSIHKVPSYIVSNIAGGNTFYIGE